MNVDWSTDWNLFVARLIELLEGGSNELEISNQFRRREVLWQGKVTSVELEEKYVPCVAMSMGAHGVPMVNGRYMDADHIVLHIEPHENDTWQDCKVGDLVKFTGYIGKTSPEIKLHEFDDGMVGLMLGMTNCRKVVGNSHAGHEFGRRMDANLSESAKPASGEHRDQDLAPKPYTGTQETLSIVAAAMDSINKLEGRIETAVMEYDQLKQSCEFVVKEWRWASAEMNHLRLLDNERGRYPRGRWLKKRPANSEDCFEYGIDYQGRTTVIRQGIWGADVPVHETFFIYEDDYAEAIKYAPMFKNTRENKDVSVIRQSILNNVTTDCTWYATHQRGYDTYQYESGNLISIDATWTNQPHRDEDVLSAQYEASYDDAGMLTLLNVEYRALGSHKGGTFNCYKKRRKK